MLWVMPSSAGPAAGATHSTRCASAGSSFAETLDFVTPHHSYLWAWQMLSDALKRLYEDFHGASKIPKAT